jgi:hypothetical protein
MDKNKKQKFIPKQDFRTRLAQRDLEISMQDYEYFKELRLKALREQEKRL